MICRAYNNNNVNYVRGAVENDGGLVSKFSLLIGLVIGFRVLVYLKKLITS